MTIYGWDASDFDWDRGSMNLAAAKQSGIDFFTHKATESTNVKHAHYADGLNRARSAGIPFLGAYHVVRSTTNIAVQVDYFVNYVDSKTPWWRSWPGWFFQVDLEKWPYDQVPAYVGTRFADLLKQKTGRTVIIYASKGQYGDSLAGTPHHLWNANYGNNASKNFKQLYSDRGADQGVGWSSYSGAVPRIWQYGSNAIIGTQHTCDANAFRGTAEEFARMIGVSQVALDEVYGLASNPNDGRTTPTRVVDLWLGETEHQGPEAYPGGYGVPTARTQRLIRMEGKMDQVLTKLVAGFDYERVAELVAAKLPDGVSKEMVVSAFNDPDVQAVLKAKAFEGAQEAETK